MNHSDNLHDFDNPDVPSIDDLESLSSEEHENNEYIDEISEKPINKENDKYESIREDSHVIDKKKTLLAHKETKERKNSELKFVKTQKNRSVTSQIESSTKDSDKSTPLHPLPAPVFNPAPLPSSQNNQPLPSSQNNPSPLAPRSPLTTTHLQNPESSGPPSRLQFLTFDSDELSLCLFLSTGMSTAL